MLCVFFYDNAECSNKRPFFLFLVAVPTFLQLAQNHTPTYCTRYPDGGCIYNKVLLNSVYLSCRWSLSRKPRRMGVSRLPSAEGEPNFPSLKDFPITTLSGMRRVLHKALEEVAFNRLPFGTRDSLIRGIV